MKRIALAALLGGITLFAWGAVSHMVLKLGVAGLRSAPVAPGDQRLLDALRETLPQDGMYMFPGIDMTKQDDPAERGRWEARTADNPHGLIVIHDQPYGGMGAPLVRELLIDITVALVAAFLLTWTGRCGARYVARVGFVTLLGLIASFRSVQLWNWYEFPGTYTLAQVADALLAFLVLGLVIAAIVKPSVHVHDEPAPVAA